MSYNSFYLGYVLVHVLTVGLTVGLAGYMYRRSGEKPIGKAFAAMVAAFAIWTGFSLLRTFTTDPTLYVGLTTLKYVGVATAPVWFVVFALLHADGEQFVSRRVVGALLVLPAITIVLIASTQFHGLFYSDLTVATVAGRELSQTTRGPWFWVFAVYGWGLLAVGSVVFAYGAYRLPWIYRAQAALVVVGIAVPWMASLGYILYDWPHPAVDPTPLGFGIASLLWAVGIFSTDLADVSPVARSRVVSALDNPVFILDTEHRLVDVNDAGQRLIDTPSPYGTAATDLLPATLASLVTEETADHTWRSDPITLEVDGAPRAFQYRLLPVGMDGKYGTVLILSDVTELVATKQRVERQNRVLARKNAQLDKFASVVSHDLRNPLTVARTNLVLLDEETDSEHLEPIAEALERMNVLLDDVLELAQQGEVVGETEPVDLETVVNAAWQNIDTADASLRVEDSETVQADESRLVEVFENLFQNAVDHGGEDVTVRVGSLPDGFYVQDDGPGIPESVREDVFEYGFSTSESGTGFGLNIVQSIVAAHGWDIQVTDGEDGGARFEITTTDFSTDSELGYIPYEAA